MRISGNAKGTVKENVIKIEFKKFRLQKNENVILSLEI